MAIVAMADAVPGGVASSAEYNKLIDNIQDLDARLGPVALPDDVSARLTVLESRTTNTSGNVGIGNQRLSDRLGAGITTASTAAAQIAAVAATTGTSVDICFAYQANEQVIAQNTPVILDAELTDTNSMHSTVTNNTRITIQKAGVYLIGGGVGYVGGGLTASRRVAYINKNGTSIPGTSINAYPSQNAAWNLMVPTQVIPVTFAANDYIELIGYWGAEDTTITGTNRKTVVTAGYNSFLYAIYLRP